jgi:hypothetical protein
LNPNSEVERGAHAPPRAVFRALAENICRTEKSGDIGKASRAKLLDASRVQQTPEAAVLPNFGVWVEPFTLFRSSVQATVARSTVEGTSALVEPTANEQLATDPQPFAKDSLKDRQNSKAVLTDGKALYSQSRTARSAAFHATAREQAPVVSNVQRAGDFDTAALRTGALRFGWFGMSSARDSCYFFFRERWHAHFTISGGDRRRTTLDGRGID